MIHRLLLQITLGATLACIAHAANAQTAFQQAPDGTVSMEMENFDQNVPGSGASWTLVSDVDASSTLAMQAPVTGQPRLEYRINFTQTGTHFVFVRAQGNSGSSNSMWLGFDGDFFQYNVNINPLNSWQWEGGFSINVPAPGEYTVTMVRRETNALGDKVVIKTSNVAPTDTGPVQSPRGGGDLAPVVAITSPADASNFLLADPVLFSGTAIDNEDGDLSASLLWASDRDGTIGVGATFSTSLSVGTHTITASAEDSGLQTGFSAITVTINDPANTAPTVTITAPGDGASFVFGDLIGFTVSVIDTEDGDLSAGVAWTSSLDGALGTGAGLPLSTLSVGVHTITASVSDFGALPGSDAITVTVTANELPIVTITSPGNGGTFNDGDTINFAATANDAENGDLSAALSWISSIDGVIGSGGFFSSSGLSPGSHTISAEATDTQLQIGSSSIMITVNTVGGGIGPFEQGVDGTISIEMENFDQSVVGSGVSWTLVSDVGASSAMAMQAPGTGQPRLEYQVKFRQAGTHFVFVRAQGNSGSSNSMWLGFNGNFFQNNVTINPLNSWQWEGGYSINVPAPGEYTVTMVRRETNTLGDKIVITTSNVAPTGTGPVQSPRGGSGNLAPVVTITSPADASNFLLGDLVSFSGTAIDNEDGDISGGLSWTSSLDGAIGSASGFSVSSLTAGSHSITASIADSGGLPGSDTIDVIVQLPGGTTPGLPFTEPFDDTNLLDASNTLADWNTSQSLLTTDSIEPLQDAFNAASAAIDIGSSAALDHDVALGDIDGDGDKDMVLVGNGADRYYLNNGTSVPFSIATAAVALQDSSGASRGVVLEDLDQDGHLDIVVVKNSPAVVNKIYFNNGTSSPFNGVVPLDLGTNLVATGSVDVGDIDGDGDPDIVVGNWASADMYYLNLGNRIFSAEMAITVPLDIKTKAVRLGDVDLDGRLDLVVATTLDGILVDGVVRLDLAVGVDEGTFLYLNNGTATPFASVVPTRISEDENKFGSNGSMDLGDVNGDGYLDVLVGNLMFDRLYLNNASGPGSDPFLGVAGVDVSPDERNTQSAVLADIDNDGDLDYLAGNEPRTHGLPADRVGTDRLYLNDGSGNFGAGIDISSDMVGDSQAIAATDIDDDGALDIVIADLTGVSRYVLNTGGASGLPNTRQLHGHAQSLRVDTETSNIAGVMLTTVDTIPAHTTIRYSLSNNGGQDWVRAYPGVQSTFVTAGNDLRWRADLESRSPAGFPSTDSLMIDLVVTSGGSGPFQQGANGTVSMEMENFDASNISSGASFALVSVTDASGGRAMQAPADGTPWLGYQVQFTQSGAHIVYVRGYGTSGGSNSLWLGFNGDIFQYNVNIGPLNSWQWEGGFVINVPAPGEYTLSIARRETSAMGDKIVIQTDLGTPAGTGPDESPRGP